METDKSSRLSSDLALECKTSALLQAELSEAQAREGSAKGDAAYLEALVQRYEQRVFDLEEVEVELREKLALLEQACNVVAFVNSLAGGGGGGVDVRALMFTQTPSTSPMEQDSLELSILQRDRAELKSDMALEERVRRIAELEDTVAELRAAARQSVETTQKERLSEAKEEAYSQTIAEADAILSMVEAGYQSTIATLKDELAQLGTKADDMERRETAITEEVACLRRRGHAEGSNEGSKIAELLGRLVDTERRESELKQKVYALESADRESGLQLMDQQRAKLEQEDRDLLLAAKVRELQQTEGFLRGRVDELEETEAALRADAAAADRAARDSERAWREKTTGLAGELDARREDSLGETATRNALRIEVEGLGGRLAAAKKTAAALEADADAVEASFKSEVSVPPSVLDGDDAVKRSKQCNDKPRVAPKTSFCLTRYRSIRDHTGRYFLVVKIP